jgi:uncharacterized membrane protein YsdA (DUF1294 family)
MIPILFLAVTICAYNLVIFGVYWWDKQAARNNAWRVSESTLLLLALAGGGPGAFAGQRLLRHKTRRQPFRVLLPMLFVTQIALLLVALMVPEVLVLLWERLG